MEYFLIWNTGGDTKKLDPESGNIENHRVVNRLLNMWCFITFLSLILITIASHNTFGKILRFKVVKVLEYSEQGENLL